MIRIAITAAAFDAIAATMPYGDTGYEMRRTETGNRPAGDGPAGRRPPPG
jgi:hypothetical protein